MMTQKHPSSDRPVAAEVPSLPTIRLCGMDLAQITTENLVEFVLSALRARRGGWLVTANLDILRRHHLDESACRVFDSADLRVADGMPLVWASRLQGERLPERVAGSSFIWELVEACAAEGHSIYLLGGAPGDAAAAVDTFQKRWPPLKVAGHSAPMVTSPVSEAELESILAELQQNIPDVLFVGLGSPKQDYLCQRLRDALPHTWLVGVGVSFSFVSGSVRRAPAVLQKTGLEWMHRMVQEPRRLAKRYLIEDLPFAATLFAHAAAARFRR